MKKALAFAFIAFFVSVSAWAGGRRNSQQYQQRGGGNYAPPNPAQPYDINACQNPYLARDYSYGYDYLIHGRCASYTQPLPRPAYYPRPYPVAVPVVTRVVVTAPPDFTGIFHEVGCWLRDCNPCCQQKVAVQQSQPQPEPQYMPPPPQPQCQFCVHVTGVNEIARTAVIEGFRRRGFKIFGEMAEGVSEANVIYIIAGDPQVKIWLDITDPRTKQVHHFGKAKYFRGGHDSDASGRELDATFEVAEKVVEEATGMKQQVAPASESRSLTKAGEWY